MNILSRYIIKQFLFNFVILFTVVMLLFVMVDLILDADEFIEAGKHWSRYNAVLAQVDQVDASFQVLDQLSRDHALAGDIVKRLPLLDRPQAVRLAKALQPSDWAVTWETLYQIVNYYGPMILMIYVFFSGLLVVAAMGFTYSALSRTRELTAMVSSGISLYRVATPVLIVGALLNAVTLPMQEFVIPRLADQLSRGKSDIKNIHNRSVALQLVSDGKDDLLSAERFSFDKQQLQGVVIQHRNDQRVTVERITAAQASWDAARQGWDLIQGYAVQPSIEDPSGGRLTLAEALPYDFYKTPMTPAVLQARRATSYPYLLPMSQLRPMQNNPAVGAKNQARITKIIWGRFSLLVLNVLVLVMGLPFFLSRSPMNMLVQAAKCAGVCIGAWAGGIVMLQGGEGWLPPVAAAWFAVVIYLPVSAWLLQTIKT